MDRLKQFVICVVWLFAIVGIGLVAQSASDHSGDDGVAPQHPESGQVAVPQVVATPPDTADSSLTRPVVHDRSFEVRRAYPTWPPDALPAEQWLYQMLDRPVSLNYPGPDVPLRDILDDIEKQISDYYGQQEDGSEFMLTFSFDDGEIPVDSDISTPLSHVLFREIYIKNMTLRNALDAILEKITDPNDLTYVITGERLLITSTEKANSEAFFSTRIYPVGRLLQQDELSTAVRNLDLSHHFSSDYKLASSHHVASDETLRSVQDDSSPETEAAEAFGTPIDHRLFGRPYLSTGHRLESLVVAMTRPPCFWVRDGDEFGEAQLVGNNLVVRQSAVGHQEVVKLLNQLVAALEDKEADDDHQPVTDESKQERTDD